MIDVVEDKKKVVVENNNNVDVKKNINVDNNVKFRFSEELCFKECFKVSNEGRSVKMIKTGTYLLI